MQNNKITLSGGLHVDNNIVILLILIKISKAD